MNCQSVLIGSTEICPADHIKLLAVQFSPDPYLDGHITNVSCRCYFVFFFIYESYGWSGAVLTMTQLSH